MSLRSRNASPGRILGASFAAVLVIVSVRIAAAESEPSVSTAQLSRLPVKEVTVFKDGHAFVLHEGAVPTTENGDVIMDHLPAPVMGTFWPYVAEEKVTLKAAVAGSRRVLAERRALSVRELLEANVGADIVVTENGSTYGARIAGVPSAPPADDSDRGGSSASRQPRSGSDLILLQLQEGIKVIPISRIQDIIFRNPPKEIRHEEEQRNLLTLKLDWNEQCRAEKVAAGLVYLQKGIRWIPSYRVDIDGKGSARLQLQATLLNEMVDLAYTWHYFWR